MTDTPGRRLFDFRQSKKLTQAELAAAIGVSPASVAFVERDERLPSRSFLAKISQRFAISTDWLLHGVGDRNIAAKHGLDGRRNRIEPPDFTSPGHGDFRYGAEEFAMVRRMDLCVSAGSGVIPVEGYESESLAFSRSWLMKNQINADLAVLVRIKGDSMAPAIPDGALVLLHLAEKTVEREGIYAFNREGQSYVKRLVPSGRTKRGGPAVLTVISENPAYPAEALAGRQMNEVAVVGRVRCVLFSL